MAATLHLAFRVEGAPEEIVAALLERQRGLLKPILDQLEDEKTPSRQRQQLEGAKRVHEEAIEFFEMLEIIPTQKGPGAGIGVG